MQQGIVHLHNFLRWAVLLFGVLTIFQAMSGMSSGKTFTAGNKRNALFFMISCDIQLVLGLLLYFMGPWGIKNIQNVGMGEAMKDPVSRFFGVEHMLGMIIAIALVHIGYSASKKAATDAAKFKKLFWFSLIAILVMVITIPWPFREGLGRPLFPGM
jgi:hypothetical protein